MRKRIVIYFIISILFSVFIYKYFDGKEEKFYEIYLNNRVIGYYNNKLAAKEVCAAVCTDINARVDKVRLMPNDFRFKQVNNDIASSNLYEIKENILKSLNGEAKLFNLMIDDKSYGMIAKEEEGKKVLQKIGELYIDENDIDVKNVVSMDIATNFKYENTKASLSKLSSIEKIAEEIFEENRENSLVEVRVKCIENRVEDVPSQVKIIKDDNMYIGERKEEAGVNGSKEVIAEVTYKNGVKEKENIIKEDIVKGAKDTIVYKGVKNPVVDGIAFLEHPTRGGYITSNFGFRWGRSHNGLDIAHNVGDAVYSAFDGTVKECHYENGYGNKILIQHEGNIQTIYGHLSKFDVKVGQEVKKGDIIGKVGNTGRSTGPHLHFEVRVNGKPVDPTTYIEN